jgi:hypothetical protein
MHVVYNSKDLTMYTLVVDVLVVYDIQCSK